MQYAPCLDVLIVRLLYGKLGGPLAVVALVLGVDARTRYTARQLLAVHDLYGLQLKESRAAYIRRNDVLSHLGVRARGGAERYLELLAEDREVFFIRFGITDALGRGIGGDIFDPVFVSGYLEALVYAEGDSSAVIFFFQSAEQFVYAQRYHFFTHSYPCLIALY